MKQFTYTIKDELGLHARPAGVLAKTARGYKSKITLESGGKKAAATQLMMVMGMGVKKGADVTVTVEGEDEDMVFEAMEKFFEENF